MAKGKRNGYVKRDEFVERGWRTISTHMQTNEVRNVIIHYRRSANGTLTEVEASSHRGAGSGHFQANQRTSQAHPIPLRVPPASSCQEMFWCRHNDTTKAL